MSTETVTLRVVLRRARGYHPSVVRVTVPAVCPKCGGPRATKVWNYNFYEDGETHSTDCWENPCGHVDMYDDVLAEEAAFKLQQRAAADEEERREHSWMF